MSQTAPNYTPALRRPAPQAAGTYWLALLGVILAVKAILLLADHAPMFYLGDSQAYLATAKDNYIPADRSFLYGFIIKVVALWTGSLTPLLISQMLATTTAAVLCGWILRHYFAAPRAVAAAMAVLCAVEPLQLMYERYVMTESFSLAVFAAFVAAALAYLQRPTPRRLVLMQVAGVVLIAFRVSFLPMVQAATVLVPLLTLAGATPRTAQPDRPPVPNSPPRYRRIAGHLVLSVVLMLGLHTAYKWGYALAIRSYLPQAGPAYHYDNGFHLLCFVAPIAQPQDFPHPEKAAELFRTRFDLQDPQMRIKQRWVEGGLVRNLQAAYPDRLEANRLAEVTAWNAVKRDPWGEARLAWFGFADYWNREHLQAGLITDRGSDRELPGELLSDLRNCYGISGERLPFLATLTNSYFFAAWPWYLGLLLLPAPLVALVVLVPASQRPGVMLLFVFAGAQVAVIAACSIVPTVRFLHAMAWMAVIVAGVFVSRVVAWRQAAGSRA